MTLAISDVPGDDPAVIVSRPTVFDGSTPTDALATLERYRIDVSDVMRVRLERVSDSPSCAAIVDYWLIASPMTLLAAADVTRAGGLTPLVTPRRFGRREPGNRDGNVLHDRC